MIKDEHPEIVTSWRHTLRVFWLSGLRLAELPELYWDRPDKLYVHGIDRQWPMLRIRQELEKGNRDRLYPLTPDFVELLREAPPEGRTGLVARPLTSDEVTTCAYTISRTISDIGKEAGSRGEYADGDRPGHRRGAGSCEIRLAT